jgi:hypothetical protein
VASSHYFDRRNPLCEGVKRLSKGGKFCQPGVENLFNLTLLAEIICETNA